MEWVRQLLELKLIHQQQNLRWLINRFSSTAHFAKTALDRMDRSRTRLQQENDYDVFRGIEGSASKWYWAAVALSLKKHTEFDGRVKRGPKDLFNKGLNYVYGITYGIIESSLLMCGLDPYIGFFHVIQYDKPTLAYDQIEPFRPWADRILIQMFMQKMITDEDVEEETGLLTSDCRKKIIQYYYKVMHERSLLNGKKIKRIDHIHYLSQTLAQQIRNYDYKNDHL
ncbi:MAG: CRISPR-associated endonuclease Cas1 [Saprospiraceae bacterium]|nr:CRISPR-associated endonuclease Cas1 [Saprospiraceae bacterium]